MPIIPSILDTDLYKFTTSYAYSKLYPRAYGQFRFIDRNDTCYPKGFAEQLKEEIKSMAQLSLSRDEELFLHQELPYLPPTYIDFLKGFRFNPDEIIIEQDEAGHLSVIAEGLLYRVTLWETPILALVSELYYRITGAKPDMEYAERAITEKAKALAQEGISFSMFGMRRRFSFEVELRMTELLKQHAGPCLYGTSNVHIAHLLGLKEHAMLYTSVRHDSGDPFVFTDKVIQRYQELRVDPKIKYIIFSDGLNVERAIEIANYCKGRIGASFGIGTNFSCDVGNDIKARNIVMKLWQCKMTERDRWHPCVKLSDVGGKHTGEASEIRLAQETLGII